VKEKVLRIPPLPSKAPSLANKETKKRGRNPISTSWEAGTANNARELEVKRKIKRAHVLQELPTTRTSWSFLGHYAFSFPRTLLYKYWQGTSITRALRSRSFAAQTAALALIIFLQTPCRPTALA
jgi:hypothetical protein